MIEIIGFIGGSLFVIAFIESARGKWNGKSFWYEIFNIVGAVLLVYYAYQKQAYTNIVLNLIWGVVALYALRHIIIRHKVRTKKKKHSHYLEFFS